MTAVNVHAHWSSSNYPVAVAKSTEISCRFSRDRMAKARSHRRQQLVCRLEHLLPADLLRYTFCCLVLGCIGLIALRQMPDNADKDFSACSGAFLHDADNCKTALQSVSISDTQASIVIKHYSRAFLRHFKLAVAQLKPGTLRTSSQ